MVSMTPVNDSRSRILHSARDLFHSRSYADVGVKEICDIASVQKGTFYHFFPSKRDLALAVIEHMADDWATGFVAEAFDPELPPMERLVYMTDAVYYWQKAATDIEGRVRGCLFGNLALEVSTREEVLRSKLMAVFNNTRDKFAVALQDAIEAHVIEPLDVRNTATAMLAYLEGIILLAKTENDAEIIRVLSPAMMNIRIEIMN